MNLKLADIYIGYDKTPQGGRKLFGKGKNSNKDVYEIAMKRFFEEYCPGIMENCQELEALPEEARAQAMKTYAKQFVDKMEQNVTKKEGKKPSKSTIYDVTFFTVMYVFPVITYTKHDLSPELAFAVRDEWAERYKNPEMQVSHYTEIFEAFNTRFLGIF